MVKEERAISRQMFLRRKELVAQLIKLFPPPYPRLDTPDVASSPLTAPDTLHNPFTPPFPQLPSRFVLFFPPFHVCTTIAFLPIDPCRPANAWSHGADTCGSGGRRWERVGGREGHLEAKEAEACSFWAKLRFAG